MQEYIVRVSLKHIQGLCWLWCLSQRSILGVCQVQRTLLGVSKIGKTSGALQQRAFILLAAAYK